MSDLSEKITLKDIFEEIRFVGWGHYINDLVAHLIDGVPVHYHKRNHTSRDNLLIHSYFYD
ncbi:MAG: hypothetical protein WD876_02070 [Candidatus Pacearchaeota archaeon]